MTTYLPKPRFLGRLVRLSFGVSLAWFLFLTSPSEVNDPDGVFWILSIYVFSALSGFFDMLLDVNWGRKAQIAFPLIALLSALVDLISVKSVWLPILGWLVYALIVIMVALSALSFILAAVLRTPGCEWRAIPHLSARASGLARFASAARSWGGMLIGNVVNIAGENTFVCAALRNGAANSGVLGRKAFDDLGQPSDMLLISTCIAVEEITRPCSHEDLPDGMGVQTISHIPLRVTIS